jgi:hypothetical protein
MFNALSSAEIDGQQVELLPDRTVMSAFSMATGHDVDLGNGGDNNDGGDANGGDANGGDGGSYNINVLGYQDNSGGDGGHGGDGGYGGAGGGNGGFNRD